MFLKLIESSRRKHFDAVMKARSMVETANPRPDPNCPAPPKKRGRIVLKLENGLDLLDIDAWALVIFCEFHQGAPIPDARKCRLFIDGEEVERPALFDDEEQED
jgi:hypothetical protein